jgi:hypothetical protein
MLARQAGGETEIGCTRAGLIGLVRFAEKARAGDMVAVPHRDERRHGVHDSRVAAQLADDRADGGPIAAEEAGVEFGRRVSLLLETHVADDRKLIGDPRVQGQMLADVHAHDIGADGRELAAIFDRRVRLEIIHVHVARPAVQIDHDDRLARRRLNCVGASPQ